MNQSSGYKQLWPVPPLPFLPCAPPLLWPSVTQQQEQARFTPHFIEDILGKKIAENGATSKFSRYPCGNSVGMDKISFDLPLHLCVFANCQVRHICFGSVVRKD